ncbi:MAG: putative entry exclusion protein TrbK-alt [Acetobacteraceae bacterium]
MRVDAALIKRTGRAAGFVVLGAAILVAAIRVHRESSPPPPESVVQQTDPLDTELNRCRAITRPQDVDNACRAAWAERRRRFFAPHDAGEVRP